MSIVSFRDTVLPALRNVVTTANYDDEILRTLSFIKEQEGQTKKNKAQPVAQPDVTLPAFVRQTG